MVPISNGDNKNSFGQVDMELVSFKSFKLLYWKLVYTLQQGIGIDWDAIMSSSVS
jgi:hypothetical protein